MAKTPNISPTLINRMCKKAANSPSRWRISAVGFSKIGNILGSSTNGFSKNHLAKGKGNGLHAEEALIQKFGNKLSSIVICRIGHSGILRPIEPCKKCKNLAEKYGIKIYSITGISDTTTNQYIQ